MTKPLKDNIVIVTGAGAGIGWGIVCACADAGATVIMAELNKDASFRANALQEKGADVHFYQTDVSNPESITTTVNHVAHDFGRIDGLVNNAGLTITGDFLTFSEQELERLWSTNLRSVFLMSQAVARVMQKKQKGAIVNISSNQAVASVQDYEMYAGTKGGITAMSRSMCWSLGKHGIRVNTLSPGLTHTEAVAQVVEQKTALKKTFAAMHADGKYCSVKEIGNIAAFLLSDASAALTGADLVADHGLAAALCPVDDLK